MDKKQTSRRPIRKSTIIFYSIYLFVIVAFFVGMHFALQPLEAWLARYEASQPEQKCQEVFQDLFADPDWAEIYELAGIQDTAFEGKQAYAAYMQAAAKGKKLTYTETSAGLSGDHKYIVRLGDEKIAVFTLTGGADSDLEIPEWELCKLEIFFSRKQQVLVNKQPGHTVYINGVALDDSYTVRKVDTLAESGYLPEGIHGYRMEQQLVTDLLVAPEVVVKDSEGNEVPTMPDEVTGIYAPTLETHTMTDEEYTQVSAAMVTYAKYMIKATTAWRLSQHFVPGCAIYKTITGILRIQQRYQSYTISDTQCSDFYRYSEDLFSVRTQQTVHFVRTDGSEKDYVMDSVCFFSKNSDGKWLISDMTQLDVTQQRQNVRLTFVNGEETVDSFFAEVNSTSLTLPTVTAPEGKVFAGWVLQEDDGSGKITLTVAFTPDENGNVHLSGEKPLEPMVLYALFENEKGE